MAMEKIPVKKAKKIAKEKNLRPARIKGTDIIQFTKSEDEARFELIDWDHFEEALDKRGLAVYESGGWMKIMKG
jgi:hypothetical protein